MSQNNSGASQDWDWNGLTSVARRQARQFTLSAHDAEDLAQSVLVALLMSSTPIRSPHAWVRQVARWQSMKLLRTTARLSSLHEGEVRTRPCTTAELLDAKRMMEGLGKQERDIWLGSRVLHQTTEELAEHHQVSASTVKRRLGRVQKKMSQRHY